MAELDEQTVRKTFKYKLKPTPEQERALDRTLMLCRHLYNAAVEERRDAWQKCGVSRHLLPAEGRIARHQRGDAGIRRGPLPGLAGRGAAGRPRLPGVLSPGAGGRDAGLSPLPGTRTATTRFTYNKLATRRRTLDNGFLVLSKIGRIAVRWSRPLRARPRPSRSVARRMAGTSASPVPMCQYSPCRRPDRRRA